MVAVQGREGEVSIRKNRYDAYGRFRALQGAYGALASCPDRLPARVWATFPRVWATFRPDRFQDRPLWPQDRQLRP